MSAQDSKLNNLSELKADELIVLPPTDESVQLVRLTATPIKITYTSGGYFAKRADGNYEAVGGTGTVGGSGTLNYIAKFTPDGTHVGNSLLFDNGTSIGLGTITPSASALLDISSTTKGFLAPRMTTAQRDAIIIPTAGLLVYNTTTSLYNYYNGAIWQNIAPMSSCWDLNGNTVSVLKYIGTNDNFDFPIYTNGTEKARLLVNGNFGIGEVAPSAKLDIVSFSDIHNEFVIKTRNHSDVILFTAGNDGTYGFNVGYNQLIVFEVNDNVNASNYLGLSHNGQFQALLSYTPIGGGLVLKNAANNANMVLLNNDMSGFDYINSGRNLGIGTITPNAKLEINGQIMTSDPLSGAGKWQLGKVKAGAVALDAGNYVEVNIDGVVKKLLIAA